MALHDLTALEQASAIRAGETSSEELVRHYLDRAHRLNDAVGAYALISDELALAQAAAADASVRDARTRGAVDGPDGGMADAPTPTDRR